MDRDLCLIVNPTAGAGRAPGCWPSGRGGAARARPALSASSARASMEHARELARAAAAAGEIAAAMGGDGLTGAVAGELRDGAGVLGVLPGGRGNDFARKLGIRARPGRGVRRASPRARAAASTWPTSAGAPTSDRSARVSTPTRRTIANATRLQLGALVYAYGALRALARGSPRAGP